MLHFQHFPLLDLQNGMLRAWWSEPFLATVWFGVFINLYWYYERKGGLSSIDRFNDTVKLELGPLFSSGLAYWGGILIWKLVIPPAAPMITDGIPHTVAETCYLVAELISGIVLYDGIFFFLHWAMHAIPLLRRFHQRHHERPEKTVESRDTLRHSLADGSIQVLVNILVQRTTVWGAVKSRLARGLHNFFVIWMLVESHAACDQPYIWRRWFVGVREHRLHHLGTSGRYGKHHRHQQFFGYLDDLRAATNGSLDWSRRLFGLEEDTEKPKSQ